MNSIEGTAFPGGEVPGEVRHNFLSSIDRARAISQAMLEGGFDPLDRYFRYDPATETDPLLWLQFGPEALVIDSITEAPAENADSATPGVQGRPIDFPILDAFKADDQDPRKKRPARRRHE